MIKFRNPDFNKLKLIAIGWPLLLIFAIYLSVNILALHTGITEQFYSTGIYPHIMGYLLDDCRAFVIDRTNFCFSWKA
jgi:hypothetical protein